MKKCKYLIISLLCFMRVAFADEEMQDPTRPPEWVVNPALAQSVGHLKLAEIMVLPNSRSVAVIDGKMLEEGDFVHGYIITKITPNVVYLKNANGSVSLPLLHDNVKTETVMDLNKGTGNP